MRVLLDTNVLLRKTNPTAPEHGVVSAAIASAVGRGDACCVCSQTLVELWAVMTRPISSNGLGLEPADARAKVDTITLTLELVPDPPTLFQRWLELCTHSGVRGRQVYDARLAALMVESGIPQFMTLNPADFSRFPTIKLIVPGQAS